MAHLSQMIAFLGLASLLVATPVSQSSSYAVGYASDNVTLSNLDLLDIHSTSDNPNEAAIHCYTDDKWCYGISRIWAARALNWFCNHFNGYIFMDSSTYNTGDWYYAPSDKPHRTPYIDEVWEEGHIKMNIFTIGTCDPPVEMNFDVCYVNMMAAVDSCDTVGENNKHGGTASSGCLQYSFQPNPQFWPNCKLRQDQT
ncbi:uncharacterized protein MYCFIDRAFT_78154 [Pseudocercospora fijiensis CIRAD86]|uniref:Ecp2 effector protein domain-containing protein n=1 Tax=Pseudocercospora fijiensis (strain CIRAD86) TaxID=383855 RepID=M2ZMT0_PSEFD|nr:uncharacterized protein MYCFIDRAFT_78154 [Pseudocercospora fijiensis CIRAD86]EME80414.1 hypothetical protein MYCFIDRAFT_78154 [Pseudocercospora fijiensis CIRAD86]